MTWDPDKIQSWLKLAAYIGAAILAGGFWVFRSEANDGDQDVRIAANTTSVVAVAAEVVRVEAESKSSIEQVQLSVDEIKELLQRQEKELAEDERVEQAQTKLMLRLCKDPTIRAAHDVKCQLTELER